MCFFSHSDGMTYAYGYNEFHKLSQIKIDGKPMPLVQYSYKNQNGSLKSMRYANAHVVEYTYDRFGRPLRETWKLGTTVTQDTKYTYDGNGNPVSVLDITNQIEYTYVYENGRLLCEMQSEGAYIDSDSFKHPGTLKRRTVYRYNSQGQVVEKTFYDADGSIADKYTYTDDGNATVTFANDAKARSRSDKLGRLDFDEVQTGSGALSRKFAYVEGSVPEEYKNAEKVRSSPTTNLVERISYSDGDKLEYTYDAEERITSVTGKYTSAYEYDCHGQLITETFTSSDGIDIVEVEYDAVGNITEKDGKVYEYDKTWKDQLAKYDGKNIYYDSLGNPTNYLGNILMWTAGRKLQSFGEDISYNYNSLGQRIRKTVGDTVHEYFYEGNRLIKEVRTESDGTKHTLVFLYDASESPIGMQYDGTAYYYKKNLQGDVIALLDAKCNTVAEYIYDAWGALRTIEASAANTTVAEANPIRYRGYYYDSETGFYFLQSRYYDPVVGRFLNCDEPLRLGAANSIPSYNLYIYCSNNPTFERDNAGYFGIIISMAIGAVFGLLVQYIMDVLANLITGVKNIFKPNSSLWTYISAGLSGALAATGIGKMGAVFYSAISSAISSVIDNNGIKVLDFIFSVVIGIVCGLIGGAGANLKRVSGVVSVSKSVLKTAVSPKKIVMYLSKIKSATISTIVNAIRYVISAVANALGGAGRKYLLELA